MKTDYQNLNLFETSVVAMAVVGVGLIGTIAFAGLSVNQQEHVIGALSLLDLREQAIEQTENMQMVYKISNEFMDQFYTAFTQVAVMPEEALRPPRQLARAYDSFLAYSDQITFDYQKQNQTAARVSYGNGRVLGAVIDVAVIKPSAQYRKQGEAELKIPFGYKPPPALISIPKQLKILKVEIR